MDSLLSKALIQDKYGFMEMAAADGKTEAETVLINSGKEVPPPNPQAGGFGSRSDNIFLSYLGLNGTWAGSNPVSG